MPDPVKPQPRRYDSSRRREQAERNRGAVLEAARARFLGGGYADTTVSAIAADAGVSIETVYKAFSNKAGLLKAVFDYSVAGDDEAVAMADREVILGIIEEPDATRKIERYCDHLAATAPRVVPVQLLARDAAAADAGAAGVWAAMRSETLNAMTMFARDLAKTGQLAVSPTEARDVLWTYHAPELFELLVLERGWSPKRYGRFLATAMTRAVIRPPA